MEYADVEAEGEEDDIFDEIKEEQEDNLDFQRIRSFVNNEEDDTTRPSNPFYFKKLFEDILKTVYTRNQKCAERNIQKG